MWKLITGIVADEIYNHLEENDLLPEEQKSCRRNSRGTKDQLLIDKAVMKNRRRRKVGLSMVWIDYRKAYDMVAHSWIKKSMEMCGAADNMSNFLSKIMESWQTILMSGNEELARVNIQRGIFQGDSLSPLMFVIGLIPLSQILRKVNAGYQLWKGQHKKINHLLFMNDLKLYGNSEKEAERLTNTIRIFSKDIAVEFGISKCSHVTMKAGKLVSVGGMELSSGELIPELESEKGYKYLGILEADDIMHTEMKDKIKKEYYRRARQLTSSKLNGGNTIRAINSRAVSLVRYSAGILKWTQDELKAMDRKKRKIMTVNRMYHPQSDTDRLYIPRMEGGRGLLSIADCVETEEQNLSLYLNQSEEGLLRLSKSERILPQYGGPVSTAMKQKREQRHKQWKEKQLHGKFIRETEEIRSEETWG